MIGETAARLRSEYEAEGLQRSDMAGDPFAQFEEWFRGVLEARIHEPNAFVLATTDADGTPSARAVLMKDLTPEGLFFYTNMESRKSRALAVNGAAAATFVWTTLHRQVRFEGPVSPVAEEAADRYFASRPRGSQIAAHVSPQSQIVESRSDLEEAYVKLEAEFGDGPIPRPDHWGGWRLSVRTAEFWQGRPNRFHDRIRYVEDGEGWRLERLAP